MGTKSNRAKALARVEKRLAEAEALANRPKVYSFPDLYLALTPKEQERVVQKYFKWAEPKHFGPYGDGA